MSFLGQIFAGDEELGKKNDDYKRLHDDVGTPAWASRRPVHGWRRRRIVYAVCAVIFTYCAVLFIQGIPTDLGPNSRLGDSRVYQGPRSTRPLTPADAPKNAPRRPATPSEAEEHYHDGPIKFYKLAASLHGVAGLGGQKESNKNVLFAASSLKSVSELVPLACEMARWDRNDVHLAFMGRAQMEIDEIKTLNGAVEDCNVHWHDARPDYSRWSSDFRMEVSVTASMDHINTFVHPQITIIDDPAREDVFFVDAIRSKMMDLGKAIIELPRDASETMMWMTRLDSASLAAWPTTYVDILIQAPKESSGSVVRLLKSIEDADYFGMRRPHLTIELSADVDQPTWQYLQNLVWPPLEWSGAPHVSQVSIRHRIPRRTASAEEASARLVESFYPLRNDASNVLLLSSQAELSPLYYHYLIYTLLEYRYSDHIKLSKEATNLMGISLTLPSTYLNDTASFEPPNTRATVDEAKSTVSSEKPFFLWQAPNEDAALYFGNKWMEFHSFISNRLSKPPSSNPKIIAQTHPAWLEYMLELMRARGYSMHYPSFPTDETALVTVHSDLYHVPEEFTRPRPSPDSPDPPSSFGPDTSMGADLPSDRPIRSEKTLLKADLISLLPAKGDLPELGGLAMIDYSGNLIDSEQSSRLSSDYADAFRRQTGACAEGREEYGRTWFAAKDLFCHLDEVYSYDHAATTQVEANAQSSSKIPSGMPPPNAHPGADQFAKANPAQDDSGDMSEAAISQAKEEALTHMSRQDGASDTALPARDDEESVLGTPATKDKLQSSSQEKDPKSEVPGRSKDKDKTKFDTKDDQKPISKQEALEEAKAKQLTNKPKPNDDSRKTTPAEEKASKAKADSASPPKNDDRKNDKQDKKASNGPAVHGSFNKEKPKQAKEAEVSNDADMKVKSPGW